MNLAVIWTVAKKELIDLFRDRKTMALGLFMGPVLIPAMFLGVGALAEKRVRTQLESTLELPVVGAEHAPNLVAFLESRNIDILPPPADPDRAVRDQEHDLVLRIDPEFGEQWRGSRAAKVELVYDSSRQDSQIPVNRVRGVLAEYSRTVGVLRGIHRGISPEVAFAVQIGQRDVATPEARRGMLLVFLPYLLVLFSFLGGAALVIDVTAGERERQSLEPLLATPAPRAAIMSGKILAACLFGMLSLLLIVVSLKLSFQLAPGPMRMVDVSVPVMAQLLLVLLPMLFIGTALLSLLAASAKSMKEAQSHMTWLMLLPMVPAFVLMVNPIKNELWQFAVPFLAQNQMLLKVIRAEAIAPLEWAVYFGAGFGLAALLWFAATRRYHQERLAISA